jgi:protein-S-isoprenylcysteine O-methyltransferase Ste14
MIKALSIVGYLGMVGGLLGVLTLENFRSSSPVVLFMQAVSLLLFLCARITFGRRSYHVVADPTEGGLVTTGPYRYIRHPIYAAICLFASVAMIGHCSWSMGLCVGLVWISALTRIFCEEVLVTARYPDYVQYAAKTWRLIPFIY